MRPLVLLMLVAVPNGGLVPVLAHQALFTGRVIDAQSGRPVEGATVTLAGYSGTVKTDVNGQFTWDAAPAPPFQVIVVLPWRPRCAAGERQSVRARHDRADTS